MRSKVFCVRLIPLIQVHAKDRKEFYFPLRSFAILFADFA